MYCFRTDSRCDLVLKAWFSVQDEQEYHLPFIALCYALRHVMPQTVFRTVYACTVFPFCNSNPTALFIGEPCQLIEQVFFNCNLPGVSVRKTGYKKIKIKWLLGWHLEEETSKLPASGGIERSVWHSLVSQISASGWVQSEPEVQTASGICPVRSQLSPAPLLAPPELHLLPQDNAMDDVTAEGHKGCSPKETFLGVISSE